MIDQQRYVKYLKHFTQNLPKYSVGMKTCISSILLHIKIILISDPYWRQGDYDSLYQGNFWVVQESRHRWVWDPCTTISTSVGTLVPISILGYKCLQPTTKLFPLSSLYYLRQWPIVLPNIREHLSILSKYIPHSQFSGIFRTYQNQA